MGGYPPLCSAPPGAPRVLPSGGPRVSPRPGALACPPVPRGPRIPDGHPAFSRSKMYFALNSTPSPSQKLSPPRFESY